jgi:hypothetical protein
MVYSEKWTSYIILLVSTCKAILWSLVALMCCRQHDRSTVRRHRHCPARLEEPSLPRTSEPEYRLVSILRLWAWIVEDLGLFQQIKQKL